MAGDLFGRAEKAFGEKNYAKALKRFLCSLYIIEHDATIANVEQVVSEIDNKELALRLLEDYAALNPDGDKTEQIEALILELEKALGIAQPESDKCACDEAEKTVASVPACVSVKDPAPYIALSDASDKLLKIFSIGMMGAGGASIVAGGVLQGLSLAYKNKADSAGSYDEFLGHVQTKKQLQTGAIVGFASGALGAGLGMAQFFLWKKKRAVSAGVKAHGPMIEKCNDTTVKREDAGVGENENRESDADTDADADADANDGAGSDEAATVEPEVSVGVGYVQLTVRF